MDFFSPCENLHNTSMDSKSMNSTEENSPRVSTPSFKLMEHQRQKENKYMKYRLEKDIFKGEELIRDAILTSRKLNRYIRKQSVDIKDQSFDLRNVTESRGRQRNLTTEKQREFRNSLSKSKLGKTAVLENEVPKLPKIISRRYRNLESSML